MKIAISQLDAIAAQATLIANAGTRLGTPEISGLVVASSNITWTADRPGNMSYLIQLATLIPPTPNNVALLTSTFAFTTVTSTNLISVSSYTGNYVLYYVVSDIHGLNAQSVINSFAFTH